VGLEYIYIALCTWDLLVSVLPWLSVNIQGSDSQSGVSKLALSTSPGNWPERQSLGLTAELEYLWMGPNNLYSNKPPGDSDEHPSLRITALEGRQGELGSLPASLQSCSAPAAFLCACSYTWIYAALWRLAFPSSPSLASE